MLSGLKLHDGFWLKCPWPQRLLGVLLNQVWDAGEGKDIAAQ